MVVGLITSCLLLGLGVYGLVTNETKKVPNPMEESTSLTLNHLNSALQNLKSVTNLTSEMQVETNKEDENINTVVKANLNTKEVEMKMSLLGVEIFHSYSVIENNVLVDYMTAPGLGMNEWYKSSGDNSSFKYDNSNLDILLENIENFQVVNNVFKITLSKEQAESLLNMLSDEEDDSENVQLVGNITVTIKLNSNQEIANIIYDFSNSFQMNEEIYTKCILSESYYNIGSTEIIVPEEVKNASLPLDEMFQ